MDLININHLYYRYPNENRFVLEDINLTVQKGDYLIIIGPNGGGKTTLLKLILGLLKTDSGSIQVFGKQPENSYDKIGYVPQHITVKKEFPITVEKTITLGIKQKISKKELTEN